VPAPELVVECRGVSVGYRTATGTVPALVAVDASFAPGRLSAIAGPSGSGKSSLLQVLAGLQRPWAGEVVVAGTELTRLRPAARRRFRRRAMGVVLQNPADNLVDGLSALEQVDAHPGELSGGEQQRVAFAAAAIGGPAVLLADEPTAQLDTAAAAGLVEAMGRLVRAGATLVVTSHDRSVIDAADHVVELRDGRVVQG
jgi:ABC-type lipoprotein export system ATPase subunit